MQFDGRHRCPRCQFGGSISAEHGVGSLKVDTLPDYKDPAALALMRSIKQALDPVAYTHLTLPTICTV